MRFPQQMMLAGLVISLTWVASPAFAASDDDIKWLVTYEGDALPAAPQWTWHGGDGAVRAEVADGALHLLDDSKDGMGCYRATWDADPNNEIVVEMRVRVVSLGITRSRGPWSDGSPICVLVSDGRRQEGLALDSQWIQTFWDRRYVMKTTDNFHVYRLVIRGSDMSVYVDGKLRIRGKNAFWKPADEAKPFIQFGSNSMIHQGEAYWDYVKLGVRPIRATQKKEKLKITLSEPWDVPKFVARQNRPYLYNVDDGLLLLSAAQGPDKDYEPYGVQKSTDKGKSWAPIAGLQGKTFSPGPMIRLEDGSILGVSRWTMKYEDYSGGNIHYVGMSYLFDRKAESFRMYESKITVPKTTHPVMLFDRHIFDVGHGVILAVVYDCNSNSYLLKTTDKGKTWTFFSMIGRGYEPGVAQISKSEMTALLRHHPKPLRQVYSHDGGKTWSEPTVLEEAGVDTDLVYMSNGILACSYGRPGCSVMFSTDGGKTWDYHRVITESSAGFNYTTLREVSPGRLLYIHDAHNAPQMTALYIDVELVK